MQKPDQVSYLHQLLFGFPFFATTLKDAVAYIENSIEQKKFIAICTPNPELIVQSIEHPEYKKILLEFDLFLPDGQGIIWASKVLGKPLTERITGVDLVGELLVEMRKRTQTGLLIGGKEYEANENQAGNESNVKITVRGTELHWFKDFKKENNTDTSEVLKWIKKNSPTIVFLSLGSPTQEEWIIQHQDELENSGVKCVVGVGGGFDMLTGKVTRAPQSVQNVGLEWGWRLLQQPWRWKRQLRLLKFVKLVLTTSKNKKSRG